MKLENKTYDGLKFAVQTALPAIATFIGTVGIAVGWEHTEITITILTAFTAMLGSMLKISSNQYYKDEADK